MFYRNGVCSLVSMKCLVRLLEFFLLLFSVMVLFVWKHSGVKLECSGLYDWEVALLMEYGSKLTPQHALHSVLVTSRVP